ncbi:MAG: Stk1 family PASTA domain-containing Ser/Thr kinase [Actinomycetota bacterium]|nr:Stk1 family PASTA domain-containing Ser/Thr kinase [Actinomycetota bacterium]
MARQPAQVYSGRYEVLRQVARGGMAEVYLARDQLLDRRVALKILFPELSVDRSFVERFRREAQAAANLTHPNVVSVYDWGEEDGVYFIVMEYVDGRPLSSIIRSEGHLLPDRAAAIGAEVAAALAFAHRSGVVHRDVKPGNVLIDVNGNVKVADFGIARAANAKENLTQTGAVMGTATYFSPEQAQGFGVDPRSDVYSLGIVLYEMVTGRPPFSGDSPVAIAYKHVREQPVPPSQLNPSVPADFEAIVLQAMAKDPNDRYASAEELRADLVRFSQGGTVVASPTIAVAPVAPATEAMSAGATAVIQSGDGTRAMPAGVVAPAPPAQRRRTSAYVILMFVLLAALLGLGFLLGQTLGLFGGGSGGGKVTMPLVIGQPADQAEEALTDLGLEVQRELQENEAEPDRVFDQRPPADTEVDKGSTVTILVSQGLTEVEVPSVVGQDVETASRILERAGFTVQTSSREDNRPAGRVLDQDPGGGQDAPKGSSVRLVVSSGRSTVTVPPVVGQDVATASDLLRNEGLEPRRNPVQSADRDPGTVVAANPRPGTEVPKGSTVTLDVATSPPQTTSTSTPPTTGAEEEEEETPAGGGQGQPGGNQPGR